MDRKHALWLERGVALGNFFVKFWRPRPGQDAARPAMDLPPDTRDAARHSPELAAAMETWKEIKFEFDTVDKLDVA